MSRALDFFLAPPESPATAAPPAPRLAESPPRVVVPPSPRDAASRPSSTAPGDSLGVAPAPRVVVPSVPRDVAPPPVAAKVARTPRKRRGNRPGTSVAPSPAAAVTTITGAAVLGRTREAEPVAAALALALRRETRSKAATVAVIGQPVAEAASGGGAARRLAARLEAHGLEPRVRGRLAWVWLDPAHPDLTNLAWDVALLAAPVVFAVTAPRTPGIDAALAEQDLVVLVTAEPDGPLARAATAGLTRVVPLRPLKRGLGRELSRAGVRAAAPARALVRAGGAR